MSQIPLRWGRLFVISEVPLCMVPLDISERVDTREEEQRRSRGGWGGCIIGHSSDVM